MSSRTLFSAMTQAEKDALASLRAAEGTEWGVLDAYPAALSWTQRFAEGTGQSLFATDIAVANPHASATQVQFTYLRADGKVVGHSTTLAPQSRRTIAAAEFGPLDETAFSTVITSSQRIVADRILRWVRGAGYASHGERSLASPSTSWSFAEGATISGFQVFLLLANDNASAVTATVRYLRLAPDPALVYTYVIPARSRQSIWVNFEPGLASAEFGIEVNATAPIVAERAMYRGGPVTSHTYATGHESAGVAPSTSWSFAEGATGALFDEFLAILNPHSTAQNVNVTYSTPSQVYGPYPYYVAANSRLTIWVDYEPNLSDTAVSATVTATLPIVAERSMFWPGTSATWHEAHNAPGAPAGATGSTWMIAGGEVGVGRNAVTYGLVANKSAFPADVYVTIYPEGRL